MNSEVTRGTPTPVIGTPVDHEGCVQDLEMGPITYGEASTLLLAFRSQLEDDTRLMFEGLMDVAGGAPDDPVIRERMALLGRLKESLAKQSQFYDSWAVRMAKFWESQPDSQRELELKIHADMVVEEVEDSEAPDQDSEYRRVH